MVADKNRAWLDGLYSLLTLAPEAKLLVCVCDLGHICGAIEDQRQKTVLVDFGDHLADFDRLGRADQLFAKDRVIGAALTSLRSVEDMPQAHRDRLFFVRFEDLVSNPVGCMEKTFAWMGVTPLKIDPNNLKQPTAESDSHYRGKYPHSFKTRIEAPKPHLIPARTQALIETGYDGVYQAYYPDRPPKPAA
jgi:sulfotransferase